MRGVTDRMPMAAIGAEPTYHAGLGAANAHMARSGRAHDGECGEIFLLSQSVEVGYMTKEFAAFLDHYHEARGASPAQTPEVSRTPPPPADDVVLANPFGPAQVECDALRFRRE
jgi:hypothetical protein